ncbi:MAG: RecQ family ATP-dependent DNA helicase [Chloroflexi bacterium]|nr:RecQ family ATP-dependent DNA helicase [Chloroflexota bacterium]
MAATKQDLHAVLRDHFDHEDFRPGQERAIRHLLDGQDVLALFPTGAGKSLVYQLTAQLLPGITIVVSPLIALMKDQVESLEARDLPVSLINSTQSAADSQEALRKLQQGESKLLYVTPERFGNQGFMDTLRKLKVSLFVVDEAHCISDWGHSFRPAYLLLPQAIAQLGKPTLLALTATATPWVRDEIVERLGMRKPNIVVRGTDRPNLFFEVRRVEQETDDRRVLEELLLAEVTAYEPEVAVQLGAAMQGSGIIYTATTKAARETVTWLRDWGISADYYHGQRKKADRERVQEAFMRGEIRVIVATNAFGLGVDKPDVRFVIHRDIPSSVEAYYQEAGRAGRDGEFARCTIIYRPGDLGRAAFLSGSGQLTREEVIQAHQGLVAQPASTLRELEAATRLNKGDLARLIRLLKQEKIIAEKRGRFRLLVEDFDPEALSLEEEEHRVAYEHSRQDMMRGYAESDSCRRRYILNYFGEDFEAEHCPLCDNDTRVEAQRVVVIAEQHVESEFAIGEQVVHEAWGQGVVQSIDADRLTVLFESVGYKVLATAVIQEQGLLQSAR